MRNEKIETTIGRRLSSATSNVILKRNSSIGNWKWLKDTRDTELTFEILSKIESTSRYAILIELFVYLIFITVIIGFFIWTFDGEMNYELSIGINKYLHKAIIEKYKKELKENGIDTTFLDKLQQHQSSPAYLLSSIISYAQASTVETSTKFIGQMITVLFGIVYGTAKKSVVHGNYIIGDFILRQQRDERKDCFRNDYNSTPFLKFNHNTDDIYNFTCYTHGWHPSYKKYVQREPEFFQLSKIATNKLFKDNCGTEEYKQKIVNIWNYEEDTNTSNIDTIRGTYDSSGNGSSHKTLYDHQPNCLLSKGYTIRFNAECISYNQVLMDYLLESNWIDQGTRGIFIEFLVYNVNINKVARVIIFFEFLSVGGNEAKIKTHVEEVLFNSTIKHRLIFYAIFLLFIIYYGIEEFYELIEYQFQYLRLEWTFIDLSIVILSIVIFYYDVVIMFDGTFNNDLNYSNLNNLIQVKFQQLLIKNQRKYIYFSIYSFLLVLKTFKYLQFCKPIRAIVLTLKKCFRNIIEFLVLFSIIFCAFLFTGHELFASDNLGYSTYLSGTITLLRLLIGDFDFKKYQELNEFIGTLFFLGYIIIIYLLLLNMLVAIISDIYDNIRANKAKLLIVNTKLSAFIKRDYDFLLKLILKNKKYSNDPKYIEKTEIILNELGDIRDRERHLGAIDVLKQLKSNLNYKSFDSLKLVCKRYGLNIDDIEKRYIVRMDEYDEIGGEGEESTWIINEVYDESEPSNENENENKPRINTIWTQEKLEKFLRKVKQERIKLEKYFDLCIKKYNYQYGSGNGNGIDSMSNKERKHRRRNGDDDAEEENINGFVFKDNLKKTLNLINNINDKLFGSINKNIGMVKEMILIRDDSNVQ